MEFNNLKAQYNHLKSGIDEQIEKVLINGDYILGNAVKELEKDLASYVDRKFCLGVSSGTSALMIALMALDCKKGDAVFVPSFTFVATAEAVSLTGATPIFCDIDIDTYNLSVESLEEKIESVKIENKLKLKAIISVDLFGLPADYHAIKSIGEKHNMTLIEDAAQGFGGSISSIKACNMGVISCTSFFPAKPLGCYGDGGAIFTDDENLLKIMESIRVHGKGFDKYDNVRVGLNARLDTLQAAILQVKLKAFKEENNHRIKMADLYTNLLKNKCITPVIPENYVSSFAQYTVRFSNKDERDKIKQKLAENGVPSNIYYVKPLHKQPVYKECNNLSLPNSELASDCCLSLPMSGYITEDEVKKVCDLI